MMSPGELTFSRDKRPSPRMILEDILFAATAETDDAFLFELPDDFDNPLLRRMDVLDLHRTHEVHFFLHHLHGTAGHVAEELHLLLVCCAFERLPDALLLDALQDFANRRIVKRGDVFEDEHELPDRIR